MDGGSISRSNMEVHVRARLGEEARARLRCGDYISSSSSDDGADTCLSGPVHTFHEGEGCHDSNPSGATADSGGATDPDESPEKDASGERELSTAELVWALMSPSVDSNPFRRMLAVDLSRAALGLAWVRSRFGEIAFRTAVMARLRDEGYDAGICRAQWKASGGILAGSYEYIDVMAVGNGWGLRYIIDLDFAAQFEVARATDEYKEVLAALPRAAVAAEAAIRQAVLAATNAAQRSLQARGLYVPPWRNSRYVLAKWFGPYRRITNPLAVSSLTSAAAAAAQTTGQRVSEARCRAVGFPEVVAPLTANARQHE